MADVGIGAEFAGHRIDGVAGRGGMGVVYRATHLALNRPVALKLVAPELAEDEDFRTRFKQESMTAASIDHPNVIPIYHAGEEDGQLYITMRLVEGTDLRAMIAQQGKLNPHQAAQIVSQTAAALDAAHARGLVHRDVKPANVLIAGGEGSELHAYLTDFGLTKHAASQSGLTKTGMFVGTLDYIAPEQLEGKPLDARADVYALGCVLYQALTGNVPYPRDTEPAKIWAHMSEPPPSVVQAASDVPHQFEDVVRRAMAKNPDDRYLSAGDLGRAVLAAADSRSVTRAERSVATGDAAPTGATAVRNVPAPVAPTPPQAPAPPTGVPTGPAYAAPPPSGPPSWPPPQGPGSGGRKWLPFAIGGGALALAAVVAALVLAGGGDDDPGTPTTAVQTTPTTTTPADPEVEADIQLGVETTIGAVKSGQADVFCGGLTLRWVNADFGGPTECENRVKRGDIPEELKTANTVEGIQVNGETATVTLDNGATLSVVKGRSFWEIDGVS